MAIEIERKFLLKDNSWRLRANAGIHYRQGYLIGAERASVRVRIEGERANLNIKGVTSGLSRSEFEYAIPVADAESLLNELCDPAQIEKIRYHLDYANHRWEIDQFLGRNLGLIVAEIELQDEHEPFQRPPWLGEEISHDTRYFNVCLSRHPFNCW
ncbi:MAG: CYTH domain-containing protein [Gammaproteobacteria bacterium]|nr:CYTH domain-containing protein [Gammaproteobacteria bacterium]